MDFISQMANIGSEVGRTLKWKQKGNTALAKNAFIRALDLFDLTIKVGRNNGPQSSRDSMLREVLMARDQFCEEYLSEDSNAILHQTGISLNSPKRALSGRGDKTPATKVMNGFIGIA